MQRSAATVAWMTFTCFLSIFLSPTSSFAREITSISVAPSNNQAGASTLYDVTFTTAVDIFADEKLALTFPAGFDLTGVVVASGVSVLDGGLQTSVAGQTITLTRDGTGNGISLGSTITIRFGAVGNTTIASSSYTVLMEIQDNGGAPKDSGTSNPFTISAGTLDHFAVTATDNGLIADQAAGSAFNIKIVAQDANDNTVTSFTGTVTLTDPTGTLSPVTSSAFAAGVLTSQAVSITKAQANVAITAANGGKSGISNVFDVAAGALSKFAIASVGSPKTAGVPFNITITALDANDNTVSSFAGKAALSITGGGSSPDSTNSFSNGAVAQSMTVTTAQSDAIITAANGSFSGQSNAFNVVPGALAQFAISTIASPQAAGLPFEITITAQDANENIVTGFNGTVSITPSAGSVSPTTSGAFINGVRTEQITPNSVLSDLNLTVSNGGAQGNSNSFDVDAGTIDNFLVTATDDGNITTQTAGSPFNIKVVARDNQGNTVTSFNGTATISDASGTIAPTTTASFVSGVLALQQVTVNTQKTNNTISINGNGASGTSNAFNVTQGSLHHVLVRSAPNGGGIEVGSVSLTADDSLIVYAAGYDIGGAYISDVSVNWTLSGGLSSNPPSGTGSAFTFRPTTASASGTTGLIQANHSTALDDATGTITVRPGVPANALTITATPVTLPADGTSQSTITSSAVLDSDGNGVGANREFTVQAFPSAAGSIPTTQDTNPVLSGVQVRTNTSSQLSFKFQAGAAGGTAQIITNSVNGASTGQTSVSVGSMDLLSISTPKQVSRGQAQAQVNMAVQNRGGSPVVVTSAGLNFTGTGGVNRNADYPVVTRTDTFTVIPPGLTRTLRFNVTVGTTATVDTVTVSGVVNGTINGIPVSDNIAETLSGWRVKLSAGVLVDVVTAPATVAQGQTSVPVTVIVQNRFGFNDVSDLLVDSVTLNFKKGATDVSSQYIVTPNGNNPDTLKGGTSATFNFIVDVGATATTGQITVDAQAAGRDVNSNANIIDTGASTPASWEATTGASLQIIAINTPVSVTAGLQGSWQAQMVLQNNSNSQIDIGINSTDTYIRFFKGVANVTNEYTITRASALQSSGTSILQPLSTDILAFTITKTGATTGDINISGSVVGTDIGPNLPISDTTEDFGQGLVKVQSPALLNISSIQLSQNTVTQGQSADWRIRVNVENTGGSRALLDFNGSYPQVFLSDTAGYDILRPATLVSGSDTLKGFSSDTLIFVVDTSGTLLGQNIVNAKVTGIEINRGVIVQDSTSQADGNQAAFTVQSPAQFFIDSTYIAAPNAPFVNKNDSFKVNVQFRNLGQEGVKNLTVGLASNGNSQVLLPPQVTLPLLEGEKTGIATFSVLADAVEADEIFTANFVAAQSNNTDASLAPEAAVDDTVLAHIQAPAALQIVDVAPSSAAVSANQSNPPWFIYVAVRDTGGAPIQFDPPRADDIEFSVNGIPAQPGDFVVQAPTALKNSGTLRLQSNTPDTLVYTVTRTGPTGGTATIAATISGKDANDNSTFQLSANGNVEITTSATVGITGTTAQVNNIDSQNVGYVNSSQIYTIRVRVRNTGVEPVRDIAVSLLTNGGSTIDQNQKLIPQIDISSEAAVTFDITSPANPNETGEIFTARIDSAFSVNSGAKANILAPSDPTERVVTQIPADLTLIATTDPADGKFSLKQEFLVKAVVRNAPGAAGVNQNGQVSITQVPTGYTRKSPGLEPLTRSFKLDTTVTWTFVAPEEPSAASDFILQITRAPLDLNSAQDATIADSTDTVTVETDTVTLSITSLAVVSPQGATDGIVSTVQIFTLQADVAHSANLSNIQATISLPANYSLRFADESVKNVVNNTVSWEIQAPNSQTGTQDEFSVRAFGQATDLSVVEDTETANVTTVSQSSVQFNAQITEPPGASSGSLARGQEFKLAASLTNLGGANTVGEGEVVLELGDTQVTASSPLTQSIRVGEPVIWELQAPQASVSLKPLTVRLTKTPADENTGNEAAIFDGIRAKEINVQTRALGQLTAGDLTVTSPIGAQDSVISTEQEFTVQATVSWQNAADVQAEIQFPPNSGYTVDNVNQPAESPSSSGSETFQWKVVAPSEPRTGDDLVVLFTARDASDTTRLSTTTNALPIQVVQKARIFLSVNIVDPPSAIDKKVSPDQNFTVRATITNVGEADTTGHAKIQIILPLDYVISDTSIKETAGGAAEWTVLSPPAPHDDIRNIDIIVIDTPRDENTGQKLELDITKESIGITTETSKLAMRNLEIQRSSAVVNGQGDVEMFRFKAENLGEVGASNILLNGLDIEFIDRMGNLISADQVVTGISVKSARRGNMLYQSGSGLSSEKLQLNFTTPDTLQPLQPDSVVIMVDVADNNAAKSFSLRVNSTEDVRAVDQESKRMVLVEFLNALNQPVQELASKSAVLISNDFETSFRNAPNPFSPDEDIFTEFQYVLQQSTEIELHIYTLFGELVKIFNFSAADWEGTYDGQSKKIRWDGRNGEGRPVVNGLYLAVLKTSAGIATTKVAIVK